MFLTRPITNTSRPATPEVNRHRSHLQPHISLASAAPPARNEHCLTCHLRTSLLTAGRPSSHQRPASPSHRSLQHRPDPRPQKSPASARCSSVTPSLPVPVTTTAHAAIEKSCASPLSCYSTPPCSCSRPSPMPLRPDPSRSRPAAAARLPARLAIAARCSLLPRTTADEAPLSPCAAVTWSSPNCVSTCVLLANWEIGFWR